MPTMSFGGLGSGYTPEQLQELMESRRHVVVPTSWERFSKKPRKGIKKKKVRLVHVLNLVFGIYENKIVADAADDAVQQAARSVLTQRQNMPDYVYEDLLNKFGLASIAESNLRGVIDCIHKKHHISPRLALFGKLCGVLEPEHYMPRLGDVVLNMYKSLFPKFSSALLRSRKYGELFVLLSTAKEALGRVFLQPPAKMDVATVELSMGRHRKLQEHLEAMALPFGEAMRVVAERRAKKQKKAKGKRGRGDSKTKEVGLSSKSFQHGEIVVDVDALIEFALTLFKEQREADELALIKLYHEYDVDRDGCLTVHEFGTLVQHITNEDLTTKDKLALFGQARALQQHTANRKAVGVAGDNVDDRDPEVMGDDVLLAEEFSLMCVSNGISPTKSDRSRGPTRTLTRGKSIRVTVLQAVVDEDRGAPSPFSSDSSDDDDEIVQLHTVHEFDSGDHVRSEVAVAAPASPGGERAV